MAESLLQSTTTYPYATTTLTITAGSLVVLFGSTNVGNNGTNPTVSDNNGGSWTVKNGYGNATTFVTGWIAYAYNHPGGSTQITVSGAIWTGDTGISIHEYAGMLTGSDPFIAINGAFSSGANPSSGTISLPGGATYLVVGFLADETSTATPSAYGTLTKVEESTTHYHTTGHQENTVSGTYSFSPTRTAGTDTVVIVAGFQIAGAGAAAPILERWDQQAGMGALIGQ